MADGFHDFENSCFPEKKTSFRFAILFLLLSVWYLVSLITCQIWIYCCQGQALKEIKVKNPMFSANSLWLYWLLYTDFSQKKIDFSYTWRSFCRRKTFSGWLHVSKVSFERRMNEPFLFFHFVINGFHLFGNNFLFEKTSII